jgi:hypothetical protein
MGMTFLADAIVVVHLAFVLFVLFGQVAIMVAIRWEYLAGCYARFVQAGRTEITVADSSRWRWARNFWFRSLHLLAISIVVFESVIGFECPLTTWERGLRRAAGQEVEEISFVGQWADRLLFYHPEDQSVFTKIYIVFGSTVLLCFFLMPPRLPSPRPRALADHPGARPDVNGQAAVLQGPNLLSPVQEKSQAQRL